MKKVYLSLGSNLGNKKGFIDTSIESLDSHDQIQVTRSSSYYKTEPIGYANQDWFLNIVLEIKTHLTPYALLDYCNSIEGKLNRKRGIRWGPRTIDIDILLYEKLTIDENKLTIPHPRMHQRAFVIIPLQEIAPKIKINGKGIDAIAARLPKQKVVPCTFQLMVS